MDNSTRSDSVRIEARSDSVELTRALGRRIGEAAQAGDVIALIGPLGAGKTQLVKGIAAGLGVPDEREVNSPTFVLVNEYTGRLRLFHIDAYRLTWPEAELAAAGFGEMCTAGGVVVVEWADRVCELIPATAIWIDIESTGESSRRFVARMPPAAAARLAPAFAAGE